MTLHSPKSEALLQRRSRDLARVLATLEPQPPASARPVLILLCGLPGAGKSTFARRLAARAPLAIVGSDEVRKTLIARPTYLPFEHGRVFLAAYAATAGLLRCGISVVFDATNLSENERRKAYRVARDAGSRLVVVEVTAPEEVVRRRLEERRAGRDPFDRSDATWDVHQTLAAAAQPISRPHITVDTSREYGEALAAVVNAVLTGEEAGPPSLLP